MRRGRGGRGNEKGEGGWGDEEVGKGEWPTFGSCVSTKTSTVFSVFFLLSSSRLYSASTEGLVATSLDAGSGCTMNIINQRLLLCTIDTLTCAG